MAINFRAGITKWYTFVRQLRQRYPNLTKIVGSVAWLSADKLRLIISLVIGAWTARYLQPAGFGTLNYAIAIVTLLSVIADLGLETITVRNLIRTPESRLNLLGTVFGLRLAAAVVAYVILFAGATLAFSEKEVRWVTLIVGASILVQPLLTVRYWFQAELSSKYIFAANNGAFLVASLFRVLLITFRRPLIDFAWVIVCETFLTGVCLFVFFRKEAVHVTKWPFQLPIARALLRDSWPLIVSGIAVTLYMRIDQVMLGAILDSEQVGIYSAAVKVSEVSYFIPGILAASLFPSIVRIKAASQDRYLARLRHYFNLSSGLAYALVIPLLCMAPRIVSLLYGDHYKGAHHIVVIHLWATVFVFLGVARDQYLITEGLLRISLVSTVCGAVMNIALNFILIPPLQGVGAAIATVISYAISAFFSSFVFAETRLIGLMQLRALLFPFEVSFRRLRRTT